MSRFEGPQGIVTNGLVLNLDAGDPDSYTRSQPPYVEVLVVAGGGGGGSHVGGGGGAGGLIYNTAYQLLSAAAVTVTVGSFGNGGSSDARGGNGSNSVFGSLTAIGGGGGGSWGGAGNPDGQNGGSGGGAAGTQGVQYAIGGTATAGQGNNGGNVGPRSGGNSSGVGGGGAGAASLSRADASDPTQINGGAGLPFSILGTSYYFAGGAGGGTYDAVTGGNGGAGGGGGGASTSAGGGTGDTQSINAAGNGASGANSTGGAGATNSGGGGGGGAGGSAGVGGAGGSGIVIVRYPGLPAATGGTITYLNGYTIHTFTTSGTFTPYKWYNTYGNSIYSGSLNNGVGFNSYQNGGFLTFDGTDDDVIIPHDSGLNLYPITLAAWVNITSGGDIINKYYSGTVNGYRFSVTPSGVSVYYFINGGNFTSNYDSVSGTISSNVWYYITITVDSSGAIIYINASSVGTRAWTGTPGAPTTTQELTIGEYPPNGFFGGKIATSQIYNRTLSVAEITQNYNAQKARFGL